MDIKKYWIDTLNQDRAAMRSYFADTACIRWHNTNEEFSVDEFLRANCDYPGSWDGEIERTDCLADTIITVTHVWSRAEDLSFHVTSFIRLENDLIVFIDEYWGDDAPAPQWRQDMHIGRPIRIPG